MLLMSKALTGQAPVFDLSGLINSIDSSEVIFLKRQLTGAKFSSAGSILLLSALYVAIVFASVLLLANCYLIKYFTVDDPPALVDCLLAAWYTPPVLLRFCTLVETPWRHENGLLSTRWASWTWL